MFDKDDTTAAVAVLAKDDKKKPFKTQSFGTATAHTGY